MAQIKLIFESMGTDKDRTVSTPELIAAVQKDLGLGALIKEADLSQAYTHLQRVKTSAEGRVTWEEFQQVLKRRAMPDMNQVGQAVAVEAVRKYIESTHGSLPGIDFDAVQGLLANDVCLQQEERELNWEGIKGAFFGWAAIVEGPSWVEIHSVADAGDGVVLAHWETNYDVKPEGQTFYGTSVDISGKSVRGFTCFASFRFDGDGKVIKIIQRSDDVVRKLGIAEAVYEERKNSKCALPSVTGIAQVVEESVGESDGVIAPRGLFCAACR